MQQPQVQRPPFNRGWHVTKIVFGSFSLIFCIVMLALAAVTIVATDYSSFEIVWVGPVAGLAAVWQIAEFITICARGGQLGIHPGAHVALHLLLWLGFVANIVLNAFTVVSLAFLSYYYDEYYYYDSGSYFLSDEYASIQYALLALSSILL